METRTEIGGSIAGPHNGPRTGWTGGQVTTQGLAPHDPRPYVTVRNTQQIDTVQFLLLPRAEPLGRTSE